MNNYKAALEVIAGAYGNGAERVERLAAAGYDPAAVQSIVNALIADGYKPPRVKVIPVDLSKYDGIALQFTKEEENK